MEAEGKRLSDSTWLRHGSDHPSRSSSNSSAYNFPKDRNSSSHRRSLGTREPTTSRNVSYRRLHSCCERTYNSTTKKGIRKKAFDKAAPPFEGGNHSLPATGPPAEKPTAFKTGTAKRGVKTVAPTIPAPITAMRGRKPRWGFGCQ